MQTFLHLLPLALALAFSTVPILAALVILLSPNGPRSALPFLVGWVIGMFAVVLLATLLAQTVPKARLPRRQQETIGTLEIIVGVGIILIGVFTLLRQRRRAEETIPKWLKSIEKIGPWSSFGLALLLNIRPKSLLLAIASGLALRADTNDPGEALLAIAIYTLIGSSTVTIPIIAYIASPKKVQPRLADGREWLVRNGEVITSVILMFVGAIIIAVGIARF